uniref:FG-GAP repeat containing protein n=1 Tax=Megaviridae environmental sample TaxID=1737588 RepID=A0A5J6VIY3_9VIRU|nr:MAG: FG-GAP repeat containing protein [Megaviridae environmental sample]
MKRGIQGRKKSSNSKNSSLKNSRGVSKRSGDQWTQVGEDIDGEAIWDNSGFSVAMSNNGYRIAIGAIYNDGDDISNTNRGSVRVYDWDSSGGVDSNGIWTQVGSDIDGQAVDDLSGYSIAMSSDGTRIAIGAIRNDENGSNSGHVKVYDFDSSGGVDSNGIWTQVGSNINGEAINDYSGCSIAMSDDGNYIAIGAIYNDGDDTSNTNRGHVRVYYCDSSGGVDSNIIWTQVGDDIDGKANDDKFGYSVAMSSDGNRIAIAAINNDGINPDTNTNCGQVRVFKLVANTWAQVGNDINGEAIYDYSGRSIAMSSDGNYIAIGARYNDGDDTSNTNRGHVRVYYCDSSGGVNSNIIWTQVGDDIDGEADGDFSGYSIAMSNDGYRIAIGAPDNDGNGSNSGHVRVYDLIANTWTQVGDDINGEAIDDYSGYSVAMSSDGYRIAIGTRYNDGDDNSNTNRGHVRVWDYPIPSGGGSGDPIIYPMFDHMYDLPCDSNNYVMFDNQDVNERLILNVKCWVLPEEERRELQEYADKVWNKKCNILSYMRYASVFWEGQWKVYDLDNLTQVTPINGKFNNAINNFKLKVLSYMKTSKDDQVINAKSFYKDTPSKVATLKFNTKKHGLISFSFKLFDDPEIRNGISISGRRVTKSSAFGGFIACADFKKLRLKRPHEIQNPNNQSWDHKMILQKFPSNYMGKTIDVIMYRLTRHSHRILNV